MATEVLFFAIRSQVLETAWRISEATNLLRNFAVEAVGEKIERFEFGKTSKSGWNGRNEVVAVNLQCGKLGTFSEGFWQSPNEVVVLHVKNF